MKRFTHWLRESSFVRVFAGFGLAVLVLAAIGWMVTGPNSQVVGPFDSTIRNAMRQIQSPMWTVVFLTVTKLGSTLYLTFVGIIIGIAFIILRWFRPLLLFLIAMAGQAALDRGFKWYFARPRPAALINYPEVPSFSFPSGHALSSLCLYAVAAWFVTTRIENSALKVGVWIFTAVLVLLIGVSRVYIGVHNPTDVLAGFLAGMIWTGAVISADRRTL